MDHRQSATIVFRQEDDLLNRKYGQDCSSQILLARRVSFCLDHKHWRDGF